MNPDIIVPTCKSLEELSPLMSDMQGHSLGCRTLATCTAASAAKNRNIGLDWAKSDIVIMIDDDIGGFSPGWWQELIRPLSDPDIVMVSARLMKPDGTPGAMMFTGDLVREICEVPRVPTACIAFRNDGTRFDDGSLPDSPDKNGYIGSGFEDDDFCARLQEKYPSGKVVINNRVKVVHFNEMKNQHGKYYDANKARHDSIWETSGTMAQTRTRKSPAIPKNIHFVWIGSEIPSWAQKNIDEFKRLNGGFKIKLHDETALAEDFEPYYKRIDNPVHGWSMKKDLIELSVLRKYGGYFFDTDFWPVAPVEKMIENNTGKKCQLFVSADGNIVANGAVFCRYNDPGLQKIIETVKIHDKEIGTRAPDWWDYGTWCCWKAINDFPEFFYTEDLTKIIPATGKDNAADLMEKIVSGKNKKTGFYAVHFEMQSSLDWKIEAKKEPTNMYHGEYGEDKWVDENIFKGKTDGVFFECGALDGLLHSNTLVFERRGWTGLCVEAHPDRFAELKKNRSCSLEHAALWDVEKEIEFEAVSGGLTGWSGAKDTMEPQHAERMAKNIKPSDRKTVKVKGRPLEDVLRQHNLNRVDLLSLDIEGAEERVLSVFPFAEFDVDVLVVENNFGNQNLDAILTQAGYLMIQKLGVSFVWRKP
jgi:FkbM family methyltransferase